MAAEAGVEDGEESGINDVTAALAALGVSEEEEEVHREEGSSEDEESEKEGESDDEEGELAAELDIDKVTIKERPGCVYAMIDQAACDIKTKVGYAKDPDTRLKAHFTACPDATMAFVAEAKDMKAAELVAHRMLEAAGYKRIHGSEWFDVRWKDAKAFIQSAIAKTDAMAGEGGRRRRK